MAATDVELNYNQGGGNNQAVGALVFNNDGARTVTQMGIYVVQDGAGTGTIQMAILQPVTTSSATVVAVTAVTNGIAGGTYILPLTSPYTLASHALYYFAVYNQVNASQIAALRAGLTTTQDNDPINFRAQNLAGFTVGDVINTSDVSLTISPWITALP